MELRTIAFSTLLLLAAAGCSQSANLGDSPDAWRPGDAPDSSRPIECGEGRYQCGEDCVDLFYDRNNCGRCGRICSSWQVCYGDCYATGADAGYPSSDSGWDPATPDGGQPSTIKPMAAGAICTAGSPKWCLDSTAPQSGDIVSIWGGVGDVRFLTSSGTDLLYGANGWSGTLLGAGERRVLAGSSPSNLWAATKADGLEWFDGAKWSKVAGASGTFHGVYVTAAETWAVGEGGKIVACSGGACTAQTSPTTQTLRAVWGPAYSEIWAVGDGGTIVFFDGTSWSTVQSPTYQRIVAVWGWKSNEAWAITSQGELLSWTRGNPWASEYEYIEDNATAVSPSPTPGISWVTSANRVYRLDTSGSAPTRSVAFDGKTQLYTVFAVSDSDVWAGGAYGYLARWDGKAWGEIPGWLDVYSRGGYESVHGTSPSDAWTVNSTGKALHWNGSAWSAPQDTLLPYTRALWAAAANDVWAVGSAGMISHFDGTRWVRQPDITFVTSTPDLSVIWGASGSDLWVTGPDGFFAHYNGSKWAAQEIAWGAMYALTGSGPKDVWAAGAGTDAYQWTGLQWQPTPLPVGDVRGLASLGPNLAFGVTGGGQVLKWNGTQWSVHCTLAAFEGRAAWGMAGSTELWVAGVGGLRKVSTTSSACELSAYPMLRSDVDLWAVWGADSSHLFAAGDVQTLLRYGP